MPRPAPRVAPATTATRPRSAARSGDPAMTRVCQPSRIETNGRALAWRACAFDVGAERSGAQLRVERVANGVAEEVEAEHGHEQSGAGAEDDPGRLTQIPAPGVDHAAPGRGRGLD